MRRYPKLYGRLKELDMTYNELALRTGHAYSYIADIMRGKVSPRLSDCYRILKEIEITPDLIGEYFTRREYEN